MCPLRNSRFCSSATFSPIISRVIVSLCRSRVRHYLNNVQKTLGEIVFSSPFTGFRRDASCNTFSRVGKWKRFHVYKLSEVIPGHRYISPWIFDRKLAHFETEEFVTFLFFFLPHFFSFHRAILTMCKSYDNSVSLRVLHFGKAIPRIRLTFMLAYPNRS